LSATGQKIDPCAQKIAFTSALQKIKQHERTNLHEPQPNKKETAVTRRCIGSHMKRLLKCLLRVNALVFGGWLLVTPPGNDVTRPLKEWSQERSFDTLQECASYRERQADELIKKMETVPEGSADYKVYDRAATRHLLGKCILAE
jgi:hypothetical protein